MLIRIITARDVCRARHPREGGDPSATQAVDSPLLWIPAFAGMTVDLQ